MIVMTAKRFARSSRARSNRGMVAPTTQAHKIFWRLKARTHIEQGFAPATLYEVFKESASVAFLR